MHSILRLLTSKVLNADPDAGGGADGAEVLAPEATQPAAAAKAEPPKVDPGVQKRINELTFQRREQERRAVAAEAELAKYREQERKAKESPAEPEKRKTLADFNYDDVAYEDYLAERVTERASKTAAEQATKVVEEREQKKAQETTAAERKAKWTERATTFAKDHPDFDELVYAEGVEFTDAVAEVLADSELGPQLAYHLAQNPDDLSRISRLSPAAAGREIGKLEARLAPAVDAQKEPAESSKEEAADETASAQDPPTTKAPPPPPKLQPAASGSTRPPTTSAQSDKLSDDEWFKAEQKRLSAKRAGK